MQDKSLKRCALFFLLSILLCACGNRNEAETAEKPKMRMPKKVHLATPKATSPRGHIEYVGLLTAHRKTDIACETGGTIEKLYFEKGNLDMAIEAAQKAVEIVPNNKQYKQTLKKFEKAKEKNK